MQNLHHLYQKFVSELESLYPPQEIDALFYIVLEELFQISRVEYLLKKTELPIEQSKIDLFNNVIVQLNAHTPIQHILGKAPFYGMDFIVSPDVLIPRPETEELIELIIKDHKEKHDLKILDIGSGSGCIPIALAKHLNIREVRSFDISESALAIATDNAKILQSTVLFELRDILKWQKFSQELDNFDVIVSNPPYITEEEKKDMGRNVLDHEPHLALFVEHENPILFYDVISDFALKHLVSNGLLYFEINQYLSSEITQMLNKKGFRDIQLLKDINGANRIIKAMAVH